MSECELKKHVDTWALAQETLIAYLYRTRDGQLFASSLPPAYHSSEYVKSFKAGESKPEAVE